MFLLCFSNSSEKMSKSLNNFISVPVFLDKFGSADELRVTCLRRDYKRSIVYSPDDLVMSRNILMKIGLALEKCRDVVVNYHQGVQLEGSPCTSPILENTLRCQEQFETALCDDFDFPTALGMRYFNTCLSGDGKDARQTPENFHIISSAIVKLRKIQIPIDTLTLYHCQSIALM